MRIVGNRGPAGGLHVHDVLPQMGSVSMIRSMRAAENSIFTLKDQRRVYGAIW